MAIVYVMAKTVGRKRRRVHPVKAGLAQGAMVPKATPPEDIDLVRRYQAGDRGAGDKLVRRYDSLIRSVALQMSRKGRCELDDLCQVARMGFLRGVAVYDPSKGASLCTHGTWWALSGLRDAPTMDRVVKWPGWLDETIQKARAAGADYCDPAVLLRFRPRSRFLIQMAREGQGFWPETRLDAPSPDGQGTIGAGVQARTVGADEAIAAAQRDEALRVEVARLVAGLTEQEREVIAARYQRGDDPSMRDVALEFGLSRQRVGQIETSAMRALRPRARAARLDTML